ncbi:MAG TPA: DinB family protein [Anaerolineales bacterium]|nr:DinB family protein [Anaerolineales bacterium]
MKKQISTDQTDANIQQVIQLLRETPDKLKILSSGLSDQQLHDPLGPGERSFTETLAHLLHCEAITSQAIYLALLLNEPLLADIHPERDLGKLIRLDLLPFEELLAYFKLRRTVLLRVLETLTKEKWSRAVREAKKQRKESVYWRARGQALHELEHLLDLENKLVSKPVGEMKDQA